MGYLGKENTLIKRDNEGNLLGADVTLEILPGKPQVKLIPLTKGKLAELVEGKDEEELIREHIKEPQYTAEEFRDIKPAIYGAIKIALLSISTDTSQEEMRDSTVKAVLEDAKKKTTDPKGN